MVYENDTKSELNQEYDNDEKSERKNETAALLANTTATNDPNDGDHATNYYENHRKRPYVGANEICVVVVLHLDNRPNSQYRYTGYLVVSCN